VPNLALIALGDSHHSQGGMKFATQISPLLNLYLLTFWHILACYVDNNKYKKKPLIKFLRTQLLPNYLNTGMSYLLCIYKLAYGYASIFLDCANQSLKTGFTSIHPPTLKMLAYFFFQSHFSLNHCGQAF
jgi:hypothetical protein